MINFTVRFQTLLYFQPSVQNFTLHRVNGCVWECVVNTLTMVLNNGQGLNASLFIHEKFHYHNQSLFSLWQYLCKVKRLPILSLGLDSALPTSEKRNYNEYLLFCRKHGDRKQRKSIRVYTCVYGALNKSTLKQIAPMINAAEFFTKNDLFLSKK